MSYLEPTIADITLLKELLVPDESSDSDYEDDRLPQAGAHQIGPGSIGKKPSQTKSIADKAQTYAPLEETKRPQTIEEWEKINEAEQEESGWDSRKSPEYNIIYKQAVYTEDLFLQMGNKSASTASCEDMVLDISLPNETMRYDEMELTVTSEQINLSTRLYKLKLALPHRIDPDKGKAQYDSDKKILKLVLRMNREFDYVNF